MINPDFAFLTKNAHVSGRKKRTEIDCLQTKFWYVAVERAAKVTTPYALEKLLYPDRIKYMDGKIQRPEKWDHYKSGKHTPTARNNENPIRMAEIRFPGVSRWYFNPIWDALRTTHWDTDKVADALFKLPEAITQLTIRGKAIINDDSPMYMRTPIFDAKILAKLVALRTFDALSTLVIFVRYSESISSPELRELGLKGISQMRSQFLVAKDFGELYAGLFRQIDLKCKHWDFIDPANRVDIVIFG